MAETRILPVRSINSSACRGTLKLSCVQGGTRLEPMLQCRKAGSVTLYAMLRRGRVMRADADGAGYFVAANDVAGAIILMDGTIAGAAFYGISAAARERAFTAVRMEEARRQGEQKRQGCPCAAAREEPQLSPPISPAEPTSPQEQYRPAPVQNSAEDGETEPKSDVGRALLERAIEGGIRCWGVDANFFLSQCNQRSSLGYSEIQIDAGERVQLIPDIYLEIIA